MISPIGARWAGIVVVVAVAAARTAAVGIVVVVAAAGIGACQSAVEPSAVAVVAASAAAPAAEAYRSAERPSVSARTGFVWHFVGSSECSAAACSLAAGNSAVVAEQALAEVH